MVNTISLGIDITSPPEIVCIIYKDFTLIRVNDAWRNFFGLIEDAVVGRSMFEFVPTWHHGRVRSDLLALGPAKRSALHQHAAGFGTLTLAWIEWNYRVSLDRDGKVLVYDAVGYLVPDRTNSRINKADD